jgi:hypothetical protein
MYLFTSLYGNTFRNTTVLTNVMYTAQARPLRKVKYRVQRKQCKATYLYLLLRTQPSELMAITNSGKKSQASTMLYTYII